MLEPTAIESMNPVATSERGLPAQIAARMGRRIMQGELRPGDKLPRETELLEQLQVSRTTLREALTILSSKGFIEARQRVGTTVRAPEFWNTLDPVVMSWHGDQDERALAQELYEIRSAVEPLAAALPGDRSRSTAASGFAERDQPTAGRIPQDEPYVAQAVGNRDAADAGEFRIIRKNRREPVGGHPA